MAEAKKIWDNRKVIGEVLKSESTKLVVELTARDGVKYVNIRGWYKKKSNNEWKPALDGISPPIAIPINGQVTNPVVTLANLIAQAVNESHDFALEDEANAVYTVPKAN